MRVKVGDKWYDPKVDGVPIMVELTDEDKRYINNMSSNHMRYCNYDNKAMTEEEVKEWMADWMREVGGFVQEI